MNSLSTKILRFLKAQTAPVSKEVIIDIFGRQAVESIRYLEKEDYIKSGKTMQLLPTPTGRQISYISDGRYEIASLGLDFLQHKPGNDFDRWATRICAIIGAITGIAALVIEYLLHSP